MPGRLNQRRGGTHLDPPLIAHPRAGGSPGAFCGSWAKGLFWGGGPWCQGKLRLLRHPRNLRERGVWGEKSGFQEKTRHWGLAAGGSPTFSKRGLHVERLLSPAGRWAKAGCAAGEPSPHPQCGPGGTAALSPHPTQLRGEKKREILPPNSFEIQPNAPPSTSSSADGVGKLRHRWR